MLDTLDEQPRCLASFSKALVPDLDLVDVLDLTVADVAGHHFDRSDRGGCVVIPPFRSKQPAVRIEHAAKIGEADTGELFQNTLDSRFRLESALTLDFGHAVFDAVICRQAGSVARVRLISPDAYASSADLPLASPCASFSCLAFYRTDMV